jgi:two-component system chemotaxis sensor kinase CheA
MASKSEQDELTQQKLEAVLQSQDRDAAEHLQTVSKAAEDVRDMIAKIDPAGASRAQAGDKPAPAAPAPQGKVIPQEDVPMVLDFVAEAREHVDTVEAGLLELEKQPGDQEVINRIFRGFHTIKGMAGFLNLQDIGSLAHSAENLLDMARKGKLVLQGETMDAVFESMDNMKKMITQLRECTTAGLPLPTVPGLAHLLTRLKGLVEGGAAKPAEPQVSVPSVEKDRKLDEIIQPTPAPAPAPAEASGKVQLGPAKAPVVDDKIKVSTARLDSLIDMAGELVVANLMVAEEVKEKLSSEHLLGTKVSHLTKIVREIQELSMSMRMVPIQGVFHRMARLVRDLAHKSGKEIQFVTQGEETELDRTVVDKIADPLVHMIRNSVDHGIESPDDRRKNGKDPAGRVELRAFHKAGNVIIEIEDDGKGLDKDRIIQKAVEQGLLQKGQEISDEEAYRLIFHAGLSTAQKVTDISGRGVGMDVVRKSVEELQGKVDISSRPGHGTTFTIRLPLTLAIIDGQIVTVGPERYIIPINSIINSFRPTADQVSSVQNRSQVVRVRGELLPLLPLYRLFGVEPQCPEPTQGLLMIVEADTQRCCVLVDELLGQQQVVIKNLGDGLGSIRGVAGGAIMGDGRVSLILDVPGLIELSQS